MFSTGCHHKKICKPYAKIKFFCCSFYMCAPSPVHNNGNDGNGQWGDFFERKVTGRSQKKVILLLCWQPSRYRVYQDFN